MTNPTPETMLKAAEIAYSQYKWTIVERGNVYRMQPREQGLASVYFDPLTNDSYWVALREALEKKGLHIMYSRGIYCQVGLSQFNVEYTGNPQNKCPRQLALDIVEVISCE